MARWLSTSLFVLIVTLPSAMLAGLLGLSRWAVALMVLGTITLISQHAWKVPNE